MDSTSYLLVGPKTHAPSLALISLCPFLSPFLHFGVCVSFLDQVFREWGQLAPLGQVS